MNTDRAKEFKPYEGQYRYVDALRDRIDRYKGSFNEKIISDFNHDLHCEFTDTVEEWERPDLGARPAGPRIYTPYKAMDFSDDTILEWYRCETGFRTGLFVKENNEARPKNLWDGESYQPFINWEL